MKRLWAIALLTFASFGCMSAQIRLSDKFSPSQKPSYVDYVDYYFAGLVGDPELDLQKICVDQTPYGVERVKTGEDAFITLVTLGIYSPATVKVWCGD